MNFSSLILEFLVILLLYKSARTGTKICGCNTNLRVDKLDLKCSSLGLQAINDSFITCVHKDLGSHLPQSIDFSNNNLKIIPALGNISLLSMIASNNFIREIDESLLRHEITNLVVSNNSLTRLNLTEATNLLSLTASHNGIRELILPKEKCKLENIQIRFNNISSLPEGLHRCKNLLSLNAMNNSIHTISMSFFKLMQSPVRNITRSTMTIDLFYNPLQRDVVLYELRRYAAWISDVDLTVHRRKCGCAILRTGKRGKMNLEICISSMCARRSNKRGMDVWTYPINWSY